jgi:hypothetical protein
VQVGEAATALMRESALKQKREHDSQHDDLSHDAVGGVNENEVDAGDEIEVAMVLPPAEGGPKVPTGEAKSKGDLEGDRIACPGFHAAMAAFPSHLFVGVVKEDGSFCITDDLMLDLWGSKAPKNGAYF